MKDINQVLSEKIREYQRVHREVAALRLAASILAEQGDLPAGSVTPPVTNGEAPDHPTNL